MLDHLPILLKRTTLYMLTETGNVISFLKTCGSLSLLLTSNPDAVDSLLSKVDKCSADLYDWNISMSGHVGSVIKKLERQILSEVRDWKEKRKRYYGGSGHIQTTLSTGMPTRDETIKRIGAQHLQGLLTLWILRPLSFKPITPRPEPRTISRVSDLIDRDNACWNESLVKQHFMPSDAELILNVPLCDAWPPDKLIWHYHPQGVYVVHSACHMLISDTHRNNGSSSSPDNAL
ncbi:hypothetical protein Cgig2_006420 [Carnegiea gigantea]|uniref:Uncharacterized protein n=1 Tax=Carnegiea gigantea TaxID=171969 RepID=A0A9Q1GM26_9CARY|nr:hypothetical protein Cgig2_006420 [Carnegiea gigantea]